MHYYQCREDVDVHRAPQRRRPRRDELGKENPGRVHDDGYGAQSHAVAPRLVCTMAQEMVLGSVTACRGWVRSTAGIPVRRTSTSQTAWLYSPET